MYKKNLAALPIAWRPEGAPRTFQIIMKIVKKSDSA